MQMLCMGRLPALAMSVISYLCGCCDLSQERRQGPGLGLEPGLRVAVVVRRTARQQSQR